MLSLVLISFLSLLSASVPAQQSPDGAQYTIAVDVDPVLLAIASATFAGEDRGRIVRADLRNPAWIDAVPELVAVANVAPRCSANSRSKVSTSVPP